LNGTQTDEHAPIEINPLRSGIWSLNFSPQSHLQRGRPRRSADPTWPRARPTEYLPTQKRAISNRAVEDAYHSMARKQPEVIGQERRLARPVKDVVPCRDHEILSENCFWSQGSMGPSNCKEYAKTAPGGTKPHQIRVSRSQLADGQAAVIYPECTPHTTCGGGLCR